METPTVKLVDGTDWVEIRPLPGSNTLGQVEEGTLWAAGDVVERPEWLSWEEAAEATASGDTIVSPLGLALAYDAVAEMGFLPESVGCEASPVPEWDEELARDVARALEESGRAADARPGKERRRGRRAA